MRGDRFFLYIGIEASVALVASAAGAWFFGSYAGLFMLVLAAVLIAVHGVQMQRRKSHIQDLNRYLSLVCSGQYVLEVAENTEGELSILKNNLYKVIILLQTQNEQLKKDKLYLRDMLADISHQLKTPLTSMTVMTDLLREEKKEDKREEFIGIIEKQQEKMNWLVANLLKLSKLDAGTVEFCPEKIDAEELIRRCVHPFLLTMELRGITYDLAADETPFSLNVDAAWTVEAIGNIIKNCMEHMENGGTLAIRLAAGTLYDAIIIRDDGCGMDEEDVKHIFERFYRGKNAGRDSVGIGLALAYSIIQREHGEILVKSEPGVGTEFEIRFYKMVV